MNAKVKNVRITPRKINLAIRLAKKVKKVTKVDAILKFTAKKSASILRKLILSAAANATNAGFDIGNLYIKEIFVGPGKTLKRSTPRARGSASRILKHTSNVSVFLENIEADNQKVEKKPKTEKAEIKEEKTTKTVAAKAKKKEVVNEDKKEDN